MSCETSSTKSKGLAKLNKLKKRDNYARETWWVQVSLGRYKKIGKSSQNSPNLVPICRDSIPCVFCV